MERVILVRYTEIHLKGLNRPYFEQKLVDNMRSALRGIPSRIDREHGRIYVMDIPDVQFDEAISRLTRVFGIHSVSPALAVDKDWQSVCSTAYMLMDKEIEKNSNFSFKVFARRSDKHYFMNSDGINRELGHLILERYPSVRVDIHKPEVSLSVEIRDRAYLYCEEIPCANGMPVGTAGRATLLISGGIDSPVAGYMMAKRGLILSAVHFYSYPYTSERARDKVVDLTRLLSRYAGPIRLHLVPFTDIQMTIYEQCPSKETTVIMRRLMMKIAQRIAEKEGAFYICHGCTGKGNFVFHCLSNGAVHGLINAKKLLADIEAGSVYYDLIEVMTCKTGCVGGAGQPYGLLPVKHQRSAGLYEADRTSLIKRSESNPIATDMLKGMLNECIRSLFTQQSSLIC